MDPTRFRLVTRSDFDGLVCGMLLRELDLIDEIKFVHPKDMQDGIVPITERDIVTNLPYVEGCHLAFDHHASEILRGPEEAPPNHVIDPNAPSAARVVYNYYGGEAAFPRLQPDLMDAVDKADAGRFSIGDILNPRGWVLLNFLMDSRTGLGRFRHFRISNYELMMQLIEDCRQMLVSELLLLPDVQERVELYWAEQELFIEQLHRCTTVVGKVAVLDLRNEEIIHAGNRFVIYALFPECEISVHIIWGVRKQNTVFAIGKSIINRDSPINVGVVCLLYGGGGHEAAGTCQIANHEAERIKQELIPLLSPDLVRDAA
jgi:nanoRNase/pAp phosphatase (c-di-AMP/oligoRNAs hydrolase)